jgi:hypothetical protein
MSDTISHHRACRPSSEPRLSSGPSRHGAGAAPEKAARPAAGGWLVLAGCLLSFGSVPACDDRRIVFCESGFDETTQRCAVTAGAGGGGGGGAGGSAGSAAGTGGSAGAAAQGGMGGSSAGGTGGSAGSPVDASVATDGGDAGDVLDAAVAP